ncbi:alpha/beta fold hydrolase [soil metagenome]
MQTLQIDITGYSISVDWYEGKDTSNIVIMLPGYNSSKSRIASLAQAIVQKTGKSALTIDLSGHGESPFVLNDTRPAQHFLELIYVFDWVKDKYPNAEIIVEGSSYGGYLATGLTKYREFSKLVLIAPAIYRPNEFYNEWNIRNDNVQQYEETVAVYRKDSTILSGHPLFVRASNFEGKVLVVVHEHDEVIPKETTEAYINSFKADSFIANGFPHSFNDKTIDQTALLEYRDKIANWLIVS